MKRCSTSLVMKESEVAQSCLTLCNPEDCSPPSSSVHGILQTRILEWVAISFSRDQTQVSCIAGRCFNLWATREALISHESNANQNHKDILLHTHHDDYSLKKKNKKITSVGEDVEKLEPSNTLGR